MKAAYTPVGPGFAPICGTHAKALILGSFLSPKSRDQGFYYGNPQNRFWRLLAFITNAPEPKTIAEKTALILQNDLALWDTVQSCEIRGASDASMRHVQPNDVAALVRRLGVQAVFCNGAASGRVYAKYAQAAAGIPAVVLPSTSPANAAWSMERLQQAWGSELGKYINNV